MKTYFGVTRLISRHIAYKMNLFNRTSFHTSNMQWCSETINDLSLQSTKFATNDINDIISKAFKIGPRGHKVYVLQPYIKWGWGKKRNTEPELQLEEAVTLVSTLDDWEVIEYDLVPLNSFENPGFFGTGKIDEIKLKIQQRNISAVFVSVNMLSASQHHFLESEFQLPVYDRFLIIMQIFREHAKSPEAKLQISMAEMPYLWSRVMYANNTSCNQPDASSSAIQGCGVSAYAFHETRKKHLRTYEAKIKNSLEKLKSHREHSRKRRKENEFPIIAVVGYTNAGKTSLIKALTGSKKLEPKKRLFATLDVTFHEGFLPCNLKILYVDTIGFISDIPTNLIEPFKVTLQDAMVADIIIHIEDISHPDLPYQRDQVNKTLKQLKIDNTLLDNIITVSNKIDLLTPVHTEVEFLENAIQFSCKTGTGIEELKQKLEQIILKSTNRKKMIIRVKNGGPEMIWLCQETAVTDTMTDPKNDNYILLNVIITQSCLNRFKNKFIELIKIYAGIFKNKMNDVLEDFYGVYLLYCLNERYKGRTYIGFTKDPNRRITQHNKGCQSGGAWKTNNKGPWEMVLIVHGFPNEISALRFEWAWQHPKKSRRLRNLCAKQKREKLYDYNVRLMVEMLCIGPWNRLPLTIRWLNTEYTRNFMANRLPPVHMPIAYGSVTIEKLNPSSVNDDNNYSEIINYCNICKKSIDLEDKMNCVNPVCKLSCHIHCLAEHFLNATADNGNNIIPIQGNCPLCNICLLWGDLVRKKRGCYSNL